MYVTTVGSLFQVCHFFQARGPRNAVTNASKYKNYANGIPSASRFFWKHGASRFSGKESIMATLARPSINTSHITESLKVAHDMPRWPPQKRPFMATPKPAINYDAGDGGFYSF